MSKRALIIFVKNIAHNNVKTRLAATIGHPAAQRVYRQLLHATRDAVRDAGAEVSVYYSHSILPEDEWSAEGHRQAVQAEGDLGVKMKRAFTDQFESGFEKVAIIGSDCPDLNAGIIKKAYDLLDNHDVVVGPSEDGGYYLLAMKELMPGLFSNKTWSTDTVLEATLDDIEKAGKRVALLPELNDIDTEEDLRQSSFAHILQENPS